MHSCAPEEGGSEVRLGFCREGSAVHLKGGKTKARGDRWAGAQLDVKCHHSELKFKRI